MTDSTSSRAFHIDSRKYPDHLHWQYEIDYLGEDSHGLWLHLPSGTPGRRGSEPQRSIAPGFVALVPPQDPWIIEFYLNHPWHPVYVNIGTVPVVSDTTIHQIDLDLDVVLTVDEEVVVLDEDEFSQHQINYGYPDQLVAAALAATDEAVERLTQRRPPFDGAAIEWLSSVDPSTLA
ncbi:MAG: DUF402 domain-containing protein [Acidimicrobiia bacterium]